ncbi:MAG TPA: EamA family transporter [Myxococcota bacterium]|nr:EamA family transporter [Myxococcota bacterium]
MFQTGLTLALFGVSIATLIGRELFFKLAADQTSQRGAPAAQSFARPAFWAGVLTGATAIVAWVAVLQRAPLATAYPIVAATYAGVPIASALLFRERLTRIQILGTGFVIAGVVCVTIAGM